MPLTSSIEIQQSENKPYTTLSLANTQQVAGDHYKRLAIQPWDFIAANNLGYFEGNVIKYVVRWKEKGGITDLNKALHYLQKLIEINSQSQS